MTLTDRLPKKVVTTYLFKPKKDPKTRNHLVLRKDN